MLHAAHPTNYAESDLAEDNRQGMLTRPPNSAIYTVVQGRTHRR